MLKLDTAVDEGLPEGAESVIQACLDSPQRKVELVGDLALGEALGVGEGEDFAVSGGQGVQGLADGQELKEQLFCRPGSS